MAVTVAVVGGGVFGCAAALELASVGYEVELFERHADLLMGTSRCNQGRLHLGYHYPRSWSTALESERSAAEFAERFREAIWYGGKHFYAIATEGSRTPWPDYLDFCTRLAAGPMEPAMPGIIRAESVSGCLKVSEAFVDLDRLRQLLRERLSEMNVIVRLQAERSGKHDWVVDATYNRPSGRRRRYEVCEVALVMLPLEFTGLSVVVMDGEFVSVDPVPGQAYHMLYDVALSVHAVNEGLAAEVPLELAGLVDRGIIHASCTRVESMLASAARFMPAIEAARYLGSMFTLRSVPAGVDETDARPTLVSRHGDVVILQGGKLDTCFRAAQRVVAEIGHIRTPAQWTIPSYLS